MDGDRLDGGATIACLRHRQGDQQGREAFAEFGLEARWEIGAQHAGHDEVRSQPHGRRQRGDHLADEGMVAPPPNGERHADGEPE
jgi:hypothetical protein